MLFMHQKYCLSNNWTITKNKYLLQSRYSVRQKKISEASICVSLGNDQYHYEYFDIHFPKIKLIRGF